MDLITIFQKTADKGFILPMPAVLHLLPQFKPQHPLQPEHAEQPVFPTLLFRIILETIPPTIARRIAITMISPAFDLSHSISYLQSVGFQNGQRILREVGILAQNQV